MRTGCRRFGLKGELTRKSTGERRKALRALSPADICQRAVHGLAWAATLVQAITEMAKRSQRLAKAGSISELDGLIAAVGCGEYLSQLAYGIPMGSELEYVDEATVNRAVEGRRDI